MHSVGLVQRQAWMPSSERDCCRMCCSYLALVGQQQSTGEAVMNFHNMQQLIDSAGDGCHLCSLILSEIASHERQKYLEELDRRGDGEPQIVATVWYYRFPDERRAPVPYLRFEEAYRRSRTLNRVQICELKCEIIENQRQMGLYSAPLFAHIY